MYAASVYALHTQPPGLQGGREHPHVASPWGVLGGEGCGPSWGLEEMGDLEAGGGGQAQARKAFTHFSVGAVLML